MAVNSEGTLALVANAGDDSVSVFAIAGKRLVPRQILALPKGSKPVAVDFAGDGAIVVAQTGAKIIRLAVSGISVTVAGAIATPASPYGLAVSRDGSFAYVTTLAGGTMPRQGTITVVDLRTGAVAQSLDAGITPEHVALSPSGRYLQATLINGSNADPAAASFRDHGLIKLYRVTSDGLLEPLAETRTGRWCQGAGWSGDESRLLLQCAEARQIEVYRFDGEVLTRDAAATISTVSRPGAMAVAER